MSSVGEKIDREVQAERIRQLEDQVEHLYAMVHQIEEVLKDAQKVIVKIATSQQQIVERVSMWPYVPIDKNDSNKL